MGAETIDLTVDKQTFKGFDEKIKSKGELFVQEMNNAEKEDKKADKKGEIKEKVDAFIRNSGIVLNLILGDISDATKFDTIDATNAKEPKLQTYKDAKVAFEQDMKALNVVDEKIVKILGDIQNIIDLKEIEANPTYVKDFDKGKIMTLLALNKIPATQKILTDKLTSLESKETEVLNSLLDKIPSNEVATELFEKNQTARNALLAKNWKKEKNQMSTDKRQLNFEALLKFYGKNNQEVDTYEIKNYDKNQNPNPKYNYIQAHYKEIPAVVEDITKNQKAVDAIKEKTEDIMFGVSTDVVHTARSEVYEGSRDNESDINKNIGTLDNNGSYREFEDIIKKQTDPANFLSGLLGKGLLEDINKYKSSSDQDTKTNGYYAVILDYITETKNELLLNTYLNHIIVGDAINLKYLGTNLKSQIENFNKIVDKNTWTIDKTSDNGKLLEKIRLQLANVDKKTFQETLSKGLDSLIETFGPMLFSVLKMFGIGKGSLLKMFGKGYEKKINEIYKKEYALSETQITSINNIVNSKGKFLETGFTEGGSERPETGGDMEKAFENKKKTYIDLMINEGYYKNINVNVLQKGIDTYNKKNNKQININDIVIITTDTTSQKKSISSIKEGQLDIFKGVMTSMLDNDSIRETIAGSNQEIRTEKEDKNGVKSKINEQGLEAKGEEAYKYIIQSEQDIARYLTASLFSDKDLGYVMTENKLNNGKIQAVDTPPSPPTTEVVTTSTLTFNGEETLVDKTGKVTTAGGSKAIHELIDMTNPPEKINVKKGNIITEATLVTIGAIKTYVESSKTGNKNLTIEDRIRVTKGDIISLPEKTKTDQEKYTENRNKINGKDGIQKITTTNNVSKYGSLDINNFVYSKDQKDEDILAYQSNILMPLETTLTDKMQYQLLTANLSDANKKSPYEGLFISPKNLANTLSMVDKRDNTTAPKYTDAIANLGKEGSTYTMVEDKTNNTIIIKDMTGKTENGNITIKNNNGILTAERKKTEAKV